MYVYMYEHRYKYMHIVIWIFLTIHENYLKLERRTRDKYDKACSAAPNSTTALDVTSTSSLLSLQSRPDIDGDAEVEFVNSMSPVHVSQ